MIADIHAKVNRFFNDMGKISVATALILATLSPVSAGAFDIMLGTAETGSFSHFVGKSVCRAVNRHTTDIRCTVIPTAGEMHNITNLQGGSLDICLIDSLTVFNALHQKGRFEYLDIRFDNLLNLQCLYDIPITLIVHRDSGISSLTELKGKRINAGKPGSSQRRVVDTILNAKNWTKKNFGLVEELPDSHSQANMAFCHGTIQAMLHVGVHPNPSLRQLSELCNAGLVGIQDSDIQQLIDRRVGFSNVRISPGTYAFQPDTIATLGKRMMLVSSRDLDEETVYTIMDALYSSKRQLESAHPALSGFADRGIRDTGLGLERHPGAAKYLSTHQ